MTKLCFKIWAVANLMVFLVFALFSLPHGILLSITALLYSSLFSLPAVLLLYALLLFMRFAQGGVWFSWTVLLLGTGIIALIAYALFRLFLHDAGNDLNFILPLSFVCGYSAVLFFFAPLHYLFEKFKYSRYEDN